MCCSSGRVCLQVSAATKTAKTMQSQLHSVITSSRLESWILHAARRGVTLSALCIGEARGSTYRGLVRGWERAGDELHGSVPQSSRQYISASAGCVCVCTCVSERCAHKYLPPPPPHHPKGASLMVMAKGCRCLGD